MGPKWCIHPKKQHKQKNEQNETKKILSSSSDTQNLSNFHYPLQEHNPHLKWPLCFHRLLYGVCAMHTFRFRGNTHLFMISSPATQSFKPGCPISRISSSHTLEDNLEKYFSSNVGAQFTFFVSQFVVL